MLLNTFLLPIKFPLKLAIKHQNPTKKITEILEFPKFIMTAILMTSPDLYVSELSVPPKKLSIYREFMIE